MRKEYKILFKLIALVLTGIAASSASAQKPLEQLVKTLDSLSAKRAPSLVYLQPSKGIYETGEDLWFKGYVMDSRSLQPSAKDTTLYVQLLRSVGLKVVAEVLVPIRGGFAEGNLVILDTIAPGDYLLAGFTSGSLYRDGNDLKSFRKLKIMERITQKIADPAQIAIPGHISRKVHLGLFPEGGNLVVGQMNTIAFKANDAEGRPVEINAALFEQERQIAQFESIHDGMGKFEFKPDPDKKYTVKIEEVDSLYLLPKAYEEGLVMRMIRQNEKTASFLVTRFGRTAINKVVITAQAKGAVLGLYQSEFKGDSLTFNLFAERFPQGIIEVTLYNEELVPLAERLVYFNLDRGLKITTELSGDAYEKRDSVRLLIRTTNWNGDPVQAHLGLSVYDGLYADQKDFLDIVSYSHLYTQVRGRITNPDYYFDVNNSDRAALLDLLLLTQGWRKYTWGHAEIQNASPSGSVIANSILGKINSKVGLPQMLLAFTAQQSGLDYPIPVSPSAEFEVKMEQLMLARGGYLYIKPLGNEQVSKRAKLKFSNPFDEITKLTYEKGIQYPIIYRKIPMDTLKSLPKIPGLITLNEVVIKGKGKGTVYRDKFMASLDSVAKFSSTSDYIGSCRGMNCISCGTGTKPIEGHSYMVFTNGRSIRHNMSFTRQETKYIIYEYPKYTDAELLEKFNIYRIKGYTSQKEFWEPNYKMNPNELSLSDFRNTLVWRPSIITNEKGEATVTFYCSDISGRFIGNIEGLDSTGLLGKTQFSFMVRDKKANK